MIINQSTPALVSIYYYYYIVYTIRTPALKRGGGFYLLYTTTIYYYYYIVQEREYPIWGQIFFEKSLEIWNFFRIFMGGGVYKKSVQ